MYKIAQTVTVEKLYDEFPRTANDNDKNTDLCGDINRIDTNEPSSPVHLHPASSSVSPHWIMQNSVQMVALRVEPRGPKRRCWANRHGRWVETKLFPPALLVCKLSRRSSDLGEAVGGLGGGKKWVPCNLWGFPRLLKHSQRFVWLFFLTGINLGLLSVLLFKMSLGGRNRCGSRTNTKPDTWPYLLFHSVYSQASADRMYTNTSHDTKISGCPEW